ncbi:MAG TPA: barstar family protein [Kouleothrix sp.]|nr:barstar family protein [Kouleothrix sp.]
MNATLQDIVQGVVPPALYTLRSRARPATVAAALAERGWRCFLLDGRTIDAKATFLAAAAQAIQFPGYFGANWDAFEECLNDLSWVPALGYVLLYDNPKQFARAQPADWAVARAILSDAALRTQATPPPLYVLLRTYRAVVLPKP